MELGFLLVLVVPLVSVVVAVLFTRKNAELRLARWVSRQVPAEEGADAYRQPAWTTRFEQDTEVHATASLPTSTQDTAGLLRFAVCVASIFVVPIVLIVIFEHRPSATVCLGLPGLALAVGQYVTRRSLLQARPSSPAVATGVGVWTILHNVGVLAVVLHCSLPGVYVSGDWEMLAAPGGGVVFILYASCSLALGILTVRAAGPQRAWLAENDALSPAAESVTA